MELLQTRHEKDVLRQNRISYEKQLEVRRRQDFIEAMDREAVGAFSYSQRGHSSVPVGFGTIGSARVRRPDSTGQGITRYHSSGESRSDSQGERGLLHAHHVATGGLCLESGRVPTTHREVIPLRLLLAFDRCSFIHSLV